MALIYVIFVILYLALWAMGQKRQATPEEYKLNALLDLSERRYATFFDGVQGNLERKYKALTRKHLFRKVVIGIFALWVTLSLVQSISQTALLTNYLGFTTFAIGQRDRSFAEFGDLFFSTISGIIVVFGVIWMFRSAQVAYILFKLALLISIFLTKFFIFYDIQFGALYGLSFNLIMLFAINSLSIFDNR